MLHGLCGGRLVPTVVAVHRVSRDYRREVRLRRAGRASATPTVPGTGPRRVRGLRAHCGGLLTLLRRPAVGPLDPLRLGLPMFGPPLINRSLLNRSLFDMRLLDVRLLDLSGLRLNLLRLDMLGDSLLGLSLFDSGRFDSRLFGLRSVVASLFGLGRF